MLLRLPSSPPIFGDLTIGMDQICSSVSKFVQASLTYPHVQ
jgi:hypothetical protein